MPQSPFFAQPNVAAAYLGGTGGDQSERPDQFDVLHPARGSVPQLLEQLRANATTMLGAIQGMANQVPVTQVNPAWVVSKALTLY